MMNADGDPVLIDFGLCKEYLSKGEHISEAEIIDSDHGSSCFGSPHVLNSGKPSRRDDMYALAYLLMYKMNGDKMPGDYERQMDKACGKYEES